MFLYEKNKSKINIWVSGFFTLDMLLCVKKL